MNQQQYNNQSHDPKPKTSRTKPEFREERVYKQL
jgi:hypothetical protein